MNMLQETGWFCLQDVLSANPPVRDLPAGTVCSHHRSPSLSVYLHSFIHPRVTLDFSLLAVFFSIFFFLLFSDQIRPTIGLLCQRHSCASLVTGTGSPCCASAYTWHHQPSLAFNMADEYKLINMCDKFKQVCCLCSLLLFLLLSLSDYRLVLWWVCFIRNVH